MMKVKETKGKDAVRQGMKQGVSDRPDPFLDISGPINVFGRVCAEVTFTGTGTTQGSFMCEGPMSYRKLPYSDDRTEDFFSQDGLGCCFMTCFFTGAGFCFFFCFLLSGYRPFVLSVSLFVGENGKISLKTHGTRKKSERSCGKRICCRFHKPP